MYALRGIQKNREVKQRGVGRLALGAHGKTLLETIQGNMGWVGSKVEFDERLVIVEERKKGSGQNAESQETQIAIFGDGR